MGAHASDGSILTLLRTFDVPKLERFATKRHFTRRVTDGPTVLPQYDATDFAPKLIVLDDSGDFERAFFTGREGKIENRFEPTRLRVHDLTTKYSEVRHHPFVLTALWPNYSVKLAHVVYLLRQLYEGNDHPLTKEDNNLFFIDGRDTLIYAVKLKWIESTDNRPFWCLTVRTIACLNSYSYNGTRVISS